MRAALALARRGLGRTAPNPAVGCVLVREGRARFTVGGTAIDAEAGDVVFGPAEVPHKFHNLGPGPLRTTDLHLSDRWIQTDLDDPDA